jgi:hypothetical protein
MRKQGEGLKELYARTCTVDGVEADASTSRCRVCGRQVFQVERDPIPPGVPVSLDPEKAALQRRFYERVERQREQAAAETEPKKSVTLLPGESLPGDPPKRDWSRIIDASGRLRYQ